MNTEISLHEYQKMLLKELFTKPYLRFNDLIIENLESEHMNYHLKRLIDLEFVIKTGNKYSLSDKGKDYANLMDDNVEFIEKQPKTSVLLHCVRKNAKGEIEHLLSRRLKHPYYGKVGRMSGKVRFGEKLEEAACRELYEETGLKADFLVLEEIYHKMRYREDGSFVQDVLFYRFFIKEPKGKLLKSIPGQENFWISNNDLKQKSKVFDLFDGVVLTERYEPLALTLKEEIKLADGY